MKGALQRKERFCYRFHLEMYSKRCSIRLKMKERLVNSFDKRALVKGVIVSTRNVLKL